MAAWKPKEKELSLEDALYLAKRELAPFWLYSSPLFAGHKGEEGGPAQLFPIEPEFAKKNWIIYAFDPLSVSGEMLFRFLKVYNDRFIPLDLTPLLVIAPTYMALKNKAALEPILKKNAITIPTVIDYDGSVSKALMVTGHASELPLVGLITGGVLQFSQSGQEWFKGFEDRLHKTLRRVDPGLPLWQQYEYDGPLLFERSRIDFGSSKNTQFPKPGFAFNSLGVGMAEFTKEFIGKSGDQAFEIRGTWIQDQDCIATNDTKASLVFNCNATDFAIIGRVSNKKTDPGKVYIDLGGAPIFEKYAGSEISYDDEGRSYIRLDEFKPYQVIKNLDPSFKDRKVSLSFPLATHGQVVINGVRLNLLIE